MAAPSGITFRACTPGDLAAVRDLHTLAFRVLAADQHDMAQIAAHEALIQAEAYAVDVARSNLILAHETDSVRLIGTAGWLAMEDRPRTARIRKVFVHPDMARRGLATALVRAAEQAAAAAGYPNLFVRANINAVPLYEKLGYRAESRGGMPAGDQLLPVLYMSRPAGQAA